MESKTNLAQYPDVRTMAPWEILMASEKLLQRKDYGAALFYARISEVAFELALLSYKRDTKENLEAVEQYHLLFYKADCARQKAILGIFEESIKNTPELTFENITQMKSLLTQSNSTKKYEALLDNYDHYVYMSDIEKLVDNESKDSKADGEKRRKCAKMDTTIVIDNQFLFSTMSKFINRNSFCG